MNTSTSEVKRKFFCWPILFFFADLSEQLYCACFITFDYCRNDIILLAKAMNNKPLHAVVVCKRLFSAVET